MQAAVIICYHFSNKRKYWNEIQMNGELCFKYIWHMHPLTKIDRCSCTRRTRSNKILANKETCPTMYLRNFITFLDPIVFQSTGLLDIDRIIDSSTSKISTTHENLVKFQICSRKIVSTIIYWDIKMLSEQRGTPKNDIKPNHEVK